jgi:hypothetical protein
VLVSREQNISRPKTKKAHRLCVRRCGLINLSSISKILPIKDTLSLYRDHLYLGLLFLAFLIPSRIKVNKKVSPFLHLNPAGGTGKDAVLPVDFNFEPGCADKYSML